MSAETRPGAVGDVVADRFVLRARLGHGGGGEVWRAHDRLHDCEVALKCAALDATGGDLRRLLREGEALARVSHPHVVRVRDVLPGPPPLLVLDLIAAPALRAVLDERLLSVDEVRALACDVAAGLAAAHAVGVAHRDLKPENILLASTGAVVVDFGLAAPVTTTTDARHQPLSATLTTSIHGTPAYLAPELLEPRGDVDAAASDRYALGVVLLECLLGDNPYRAGTVAQTLARHVERAPPDPASARSAGAVAPAFADLVIRLLARAPSDRPELGEVLAVCAPSSSPSALSLAPSSSPLRSTTRPRRSAWLVAAPLLAALLVVVVWLAPVGVSNTDSNGDVNGDIDGNGNGNGNVNVDVDVDGNNDANAAGNVDSGFSKSADDGSVKIAGDGAAVVDAGRDVAAVPAGGDTRRVDDSNTVRPRGNSDAGVIDNAPQGLPAKRTWLATHCRQLACATLAAVPLPHELLALKRHRADVDACLAQCR